MCIRRLADRKLPARAHSFRTMFKATRREHERNQRAVPALLTGRNSLLILRTAPNSHCVRGDSFAAHFASPTRAGAECVRAQVEGARPLTKGRAKRVALVAETLDQARDVMIFGDSGIMECSPPIAARNGKRRKNA